ncbi:MAG: hypothetical protein ABMA01_04675 [Chthoniobacteraceae bacterium]
MRLMALICCIALLPIMAMAQARNTAWRDAVGDWSDAAKWSTGLPDGLARTAVAGKSEVSLKEGMAVVGGLLVGTGRGDHGRITIDGGELVVRRSFVQIGEEDGGSGEVVVNGGAFHNASATYIGGANSVPGRSCRGALRVSGGSHVSRIITLGWGAGSEAMLRVEGSRVAAVHVLDYVTMGAYLEGVPSTSTLAFTLDAQGVTPITIQSPRGGLSMVRKPAANRCHLRIALSAVPPREDVTLITANVATKGEFDDLPEGAEISATWQGRVFKWKLTYRGGVSRCDLVLGDVRGHRDSDVTSATRARPAAPAFLWKDIPLRDPLPPQFEPAFEGAEGFGAIAKGGRGGREIVVENLADSGPGSLRAAVQAKGPRTVTFRVGGIIPLKSPLQITEPFLSILGQTAPDGGIELRGSGIVVRTHDVVLRHLRVRPGETSNGQDAIEFYDAERCVADHCTFMWGDDETCSIVGLSDAITIQHCIIAEGLNHAGHSMASIAGGERTTWHHNLIAHCRTRNPRFAGATWCDFRNNVIYNWMDVAAYGEFERLNLVVNVFKPGPSTKPNALRFFDGEAVLLPVTFHARGNLLHGHDASDWTHIRCDTAARTDTPFPAPTVRTHEAHEAMQRILDEAGATLPKRDATDARIVQSVRDGTGQILDRVPLGND